MKTFYTSHLIFLIIILPLFSKSQQATFSGKVVESSTGKALENVSIFEVNSKIGTITDAKGFFKLVLSEGVLDIQISDNGFKDFSKQFKLESDTSLIIKLESDIQYKNRLKKSEELQADAKTSGRDSENRFFKRSRH